MLRGEGCMGKANGPAERDGRRENHALIALALPPLCALCFILGLAAGRMLSGW
jgi:hypothetical protein